MLASRHGAGSSDRKPVGNGGSGLTNFSDVNFFSDPGLVADPYPYYEYLRAQCPVAHVPSSEVVAVTGYDELAAVYRDSATFSAVNSSLGPFPLPFDVSDDDIT